jgi:hypothetical protein
LAVGESERLFYQILSINYELGFTAVFAVRVAAILMIINARTMPAGPIAPNERASAPAIDGDYFLYLLVQIRTGLRGTGPVQIRRY